MNKQLSTKNKYYQHGLTLVELMIVLAILGVLAAIAFNQLGGEKDKGLRAEGVNLIMQAIQEFEGCGRDSGGDYSACTITDFATSDSGRFVVTVAKTATTYMITVTRATGTDEQCTTMSIDQLGQKFFTSSDSTGSVVRCWSGT